MIDALAVALLDDPHRCFRAVFDRWLHAAHPRDISQVFPGHRGVEIALREEDVLRVAAAALFANDTDGLGADFLPRRWILQPREHLFTPALLSPLRNHRRGERVARRGVRILIARRVDAPCAGRVDQLQRLDALAVVLRADDLVMRHLGGQPALFADANRLAYAVE